MGRRLNGTNQGYRRDDNPRSDYPISLFAWIRPHAVGGYWGWIGDKDSTSRTWCSGILQDNAGDVQNSSFVLNQVFAFNFAVSPNDIAVNGDWHSFIATCITEDSLEAYLDDGSVGTDSGGIAKPNVAIDRFSIGFLANSGSSSYTDCDIAYFAIFNQLTSAEKSRLSRGVHPFLLRESLPNAFVELTGLGTEKEEIAQGNMTTVGSPTKSPTNPPIEDIANFS